MKLYHVTKVIDGDTFEVDPPISKDIDLQSHLQYVGKPNTFTKVRLANINASEVHTPQGERATMYLKGLLDGKCVTLKPYGISYDRVVADVWIYPHNLFVNASMVYKGFTNKFK